MNQYIFYENYIEGLYKDRSFFIDLEDYNKVKEYSWNINKKGYVRAYIGNKKWIYLHQFVLNNLDKSKEIDHINRKPWDCRKINLRIVSHRKNSINRGLQSNNTSGITGVSWSKDRNKWEVHIRINKKRIHLGRFENIEEAIKVRLEAEAKYFGEFAPQKHLFEQYNIKQNPSKEVILWSPN